MQKCSIEFDILDCTDKILIYKLPNTTSAMEACKHAKYINIIRDLYKPRAIIRTTDTDYIKSIDNPEEAVKFIDNYINELNRIKGKILEGTTNDKE